MVSDIFDCFNFRNENKCCYISSATTTVTESPYAISQEEAQNALVEYNETAEPEPVTDSSNYFTFIHRLKAKY